MRFGLNMMPEDVFWYIADLVWLYCFYLSVLYHLLLGQSFIMYDAKFDVQETLHLMKKYRVTIFAAAPTVYRTMRAQNNVEFPADLQLHTLSSAGEPLNFDVSRWAYE